MKCPYCSHHDTRVLESRPTDEGAAVRRRRECLACSQRFTTYERVEAPPLIVVKKDGTREAFDRNKILQGMITACEKRAVPIATLERAVNEIEETLRNSLEHEVPSRTIGELVMEALRTIDQVAYVRFASVYREFRDINQFFSELESLLNEKKG